MVGACVICDEFCEATGKLSRPSQHPPSQGGLGLRVEGVGSRVEGLGFRVEGFWFGVEGLGLRA